MNFHRTQGFSLIWALLLAALLSLLAASVIRTSSTQRLRSQAVLDGSLAEVQERNALEDARRLTTANASRLAATLPATAEPAALAQAAQTFVNNWCARSVDGGERRARVHFTETACDRTLPSGVSLPPAVVSAPGHGVWRVELPFVVVSQGGQGRVLTRSGTLRATYGPLPASGITLFAPGDLTLSPAVQVQGDVHVEGHLTLRGDVRVTETVTASGCATSAPGCAGAREVTVGSVRTGVMGLRPLTERPCTEAACLQGGSLSVGQLGDGPPAVADVPGLGLGGNVLRLGVTGDGTQLIEACAGGACTTLTATPQGEGATSVLRDAGGNVLAENWNGVLSLPGNLTVTPAGDGPSIGVNLSVVSTGPMTVAGELTYAQTSCTDLVCGVSGGTEMLALGAPGVEVRGSRLHAAVITRTLTYAQDLTLYGALTGMPDGSGSLRLQQDPRFRDGAAPGAVPRLPAAWRQASVTTQP